MPSDRRAKTYAGRVGALLITALALEKKTGQTDRQKLLNAFHSGRNKQKVHFQRAFKMYSVGDALKVARQTVPNTGYRYSTNTVLYNRSLYTQY